MSDPKKKLKDRPQIELLYILLYYVRYFRVRSKAELMASLFFSIRTSMSNIEGLKILSLDDKKEHTTNISFTQKQGRKNRENLIFKYFLTIV